MTDPTRPLSAAPDGAETPAELPFLARWSRHKLGQDVPPAADAAPAAAAGVAAVPNGAGEVSDPVPERIDPRTGKPMSELTDADMPDLDTLDENADLSAFMAGKVSQALRMKALTKVFHTAKYNQMCLCAEYADDYTAFVPLGDVVPHDLQQAIVREAQRLCERLAARGIDLSPEAAQARIAAEYRGEPAPPLEAPEMPTTVADTPAFAAPRSESPADREPGPGASPRPPETT
ncbi:MAG TPA: DUF3306 domain-containing protein [Rhodocyclaceae bacterium]|nr:DUF3306 domain-containing protein [Rhodocyclaceae bacterium]